MFTKYQSATHFNLRIIPPRYLKTSHSGGWQAHFAKSPAQLRVAGETWVASVKKADCVIRLEALPCRQRGNGHCVRPAGSARPGPSPGPDLSPLEASTFPCGGGLHRTGRGGVFSSMEASADGERLSGENKQPPAGIMEQNSSSARHVTGPGNYTSHE